MEKRLLKLLVWILVLGLSLCLGGYAGYRGYKSARQGRLVKQARHYLAQSEPKNALLCVRRALAYNSRDVDACRLMAEIGEAARLPTALFYRNRVVELSPNSVADRLALAQTAVLFRDFATATNAIAAIDPNGYKTAAFHNVAGAIAAATGQNAQAEAHFLAASKLEPGNAIARLNLAIVRLHGANAAATQEARLVLQGLCSAATDSGLRAQAFRELVLDAARNNQFDAALALSKDLLVLTNAVFSDRLLHLTLLKAADNATFQLALTSLQTQAANDPANLFDLAQWMIAKLPPTNTLSWLRALPPRTQTNQPAALLIAECQSVLEDWRPLQASLRTQDWGDDDFLRHAFITRALRGLGLSDSAKAEWEAGLLAAGKQQQNLVKLLDLATQWGWTADRENLLWTILSDFPREEWAFRSLAQALFISGQTRSLLQLFKQRLNVDRSDLPTQNSLAMTALLLGARELKPDELALQVYTQAPTNAVFASTYAFSLLLQKKPAEALAVLDRFASNQLEDPAISGYYAMALQAAGQREKAQHYFDLATSAPLLPEERQTLARARNP